jgi:hypothetical protein
VALQWSFQWADLFSYVENSLSQRSAAASSSQQASFECCRLSVHCRRKMSGAYWLFLLTNWRTGRKGHAFQNGAQNTANIALAVVELMAVCSSAAL